MKGINKENKDLVQKNKQTLFKNSFFRVVWAVLLSACILYFTGLYAPPLAYFGDFLSNMGVFFSFGEGFPLEDDFSSVEQVKTTYNALCVIDRDEVKIYSPTAKEVFSYPHAMQNPIMDTSHSRILLYNPTQTVFKVLNASEVLYSIQTKNRITSATISQNNTIAVTTESLTHNAQVSVYNYLLEEQFIWYCAKGYPSYSYISDDDKYLLVTTLTSNAGILKSDVFVIDIDNKQELFSISCEGYPLEINVYDDTAILIFQNGIQTYNLETQEKTQEILLTDTNILSAYFDEPYILISKGSYDVNTKSTINLLTQNLESVISIDIQDTVKDVLIQNSRIYLLGEKAIYEYNFDGELLNETQANTNQKFLVDFTAPLVITSQEIFKIENKK